LNSLERRVAGLRRKAADMEEWLSRTSNIFDEETESTLFQYITDLNDGVGLVKYMVLDAEMRLHNVQLASEAFRAGEDGGSQQGPVQILVNPSLQPGGEGQARSITGSVVKLVRRLRRPKQAPPSPVATHPVHNMLEQAKAFTEAINLFTEWFTGNKVRFTLFPQDQKGKQLLTLEAQSYLRRVLSALTSFMAAAETYIQGSLMGALATIAGKEAETLKEIYMPVYEKAVSPEEPFRLPGVPKSRGGRR
jgi:hypothetical protein